MRIKKVLIFLIALAMSAGISAIAQEDPQVSEVKSQPSGAQPQASQANPQATDVQLQVTLINPQAVQAKPLDAEAKPQASEAQPSAPVVPQQAVEAKPEAVAAQPQVPEVKPPAVEATPQVIDAPSQAPEVKTPVVAAPAEVPEAKTPAVEVAPQAAEVKTVLGEVMPPTTETKPQPVPVQPAAVPVKPVVKEVKPGPNFFAETFFAPSGSKLDNKITEIRGFPVLKAHSREQNAEFAVVTDFGGGVVKSRALPGLKDPKAIDAYIKSNLQTAQFEGVEIRQLPIPSAKGDATTLFWVGDKAFATPQDATAAIVSNKMMVESTGGNFAETVRAAPIYIPEPEPVIEIKTPAQFKKEEELILKFTDQMGIGEKMFGVFQGTPCGETITWQSFGETTWRQTNLAASNFNTQVGYWTNRIVFKGIRFPLHTLDPFIESTVSLQSDSADYASNLQTWAGLEWRPLARNAWLYNFRPYGDIPILEWMRNYRFYIKYGNQRNLKDPIENAKDYDLIWGVQCYYEWGTELPPLDETKPVQFSDYLRQYVWGEYFGNYYVSKTGFSSEKSFNAFIANSTVTMGVKLPGIPLPHNIINDELVLMPYLRFEHVNNAEYSFWYQNQFYMAAGLRIMPFRNYRWKENEWLSKVAIFGEFDGIGNAQRVKQSANPVDVPTYDLRFGIKFSSRRF